MISQMYSPYRDRSTEFFKIRTMNGSRIKLYGVSFGGGSVELRRFEPDLALAEMEIFPPSEQDGRPGVGFSIRHQSKAKDHVVACWWEGFDQLITRVFVRDSAWRSGKNCESFNIWDMRIMWHERNAFVGAFLSGNADAHALYLGATFSERPLPLATPVFPA